MKTRSFKYIIIAVSGMVLAAVLIFVFFIDIKTTTIEIEEHISRDFKVSDVFEAAKNAYGKEAITLIVDDTEYMLKVISFNGDEPQHYTMRIERNGHAALVLVFREAMAIAQSGNETSLITTNEINRLMKKWTAERELDGARI